MEYNLLNNALITGGNGMVGNNINFGYKPTSQEMNICQKKSIEKYITQLDSISCIIHLAATNLRESEENKKKAIDVNINGTTNMLDIAIKKNIPFVLISSGAVFSSNNPNLQFDENFKTCPNSMYGLTKASSEYIALLYSKTILIRTGWLFGGNQKNHYKFVENVMKHLLTNNKISASIDFYGSPTYVVDFIEKMKNIINNLEYGIHHIVNDGVASGYDIALEVANILKKDSNLIIQTEALNVPNSGPQRSNTEILQTINTNNKMRSWKIALKEYINKYLENLIVLQNLDTQLLTKNENNKWSNREICRFCNKYNLHIFFKLEPTPPANHFIKIKTKQETIPLDIAICQDCKHIQLMQIVDPSFQYSNYFYVSSTSNTMTNHLKNSVIKFTNILNIQKTDNILEIGANDGLCVKHLLDHGFTNIIGIDPASNINKRHDLPIICDFFGSNILDTMKNKYFKLIYAFHCCAHIENIQDVFDTIFKLLDKDGIFIMEVGYFYEVFKNKLFDTIYHEHIDYHTCNAIQSFSLKHGLKLYNVETNNIQGGSIQFYFSKNLNIEINNSVIETIEKENNIKLHLYENLSMWKNQIIRCGIDLNYILNSLVSNGKKIVGYGASAKSTTLMYQYKLTNKVIDYIIDESIFKQNYYSPGLHIPIKSSDYLNIDKVDYILILSWNFIDEILEKIEKLRQNGIRVIIPFPEIKII